MRKYWENGDKVVKSYDQVMKKWWTKDDKSYNINMLEHNYKIFLQTLRFIKYSFKHYFLHVWDNSLLSNWATSTPLRPKHNPKKDAYCTVYYFFLLIYIMCCILYTCIFSLHLWHFDNIWDREIKIEYMVFIIMTIIYPFSLQPL